MWWHRDPALRPHLPGLTPRRNHDHPTENTLLPAAGRHARHRRHARGVGAPPARAGAHHLRGRARPQRSGPGRPARRHPGATGGDDRPGHRHGDRERAGTRRHGGHRRRPRAAHRAGRDLPGRALAPLARRLPPHAARPRPGPVAPPGPACPLAARGRVAARLPLHARRTRVHRGRHSQGGGYGDRVGGERVPGRLVRAGGVPRPEPAVLQAAAGRRLRAGLRGRPGVPRRAARHRPPPRGVPLARRRARLHPRPPRGAGGAAGRARRHGRGGSVRGGVGRQRGRVAAGGARRDPGHPLRRRARARRGTGRRAGPGTGARAGPRCLGARGARQRLPRRRGLPDGQAAVLHAPAAGRPALVELLRPALPRAGAGHGGPAAAPGVGLRARDPRARRGPGGVRRLPAGVPARDAAARRVRHRSRAVGRPARPGGQHPRGHALPARPEPAVP